MVFKHLHPNYLYILEEAEKICTSRCQLLDVGCGKGDIVEASLNKGWSAFGLEYFEHGSGNNISDVLRTKKLLGKRVFEYDGLNFPFEDEKFDVVISNMVLEHVPNIEPILSEVRRVLRPGGKFICLFPSKDSWREGHAEVLFAHWLPRSSIRVFWLFLFRCLGFGRLKRNKTRFGWAKYFDKWLHDHTFYLPEKEIFARMGRYFSRIERAESSYIDYRLSLKGDSLVYVYLRDFLPSSLKSWYCRKFGAVVVICTIALHSRHAASDTYAT